MVAIAQLVGAEITRKLAVPASAQRLLDLGGGHGMYSIALCRAHRCQRLTRPSPSASRPRARS
jgi:hypothetical protein